MKFGNKPVSSQKLFFNDFIHFISISNIIKTKQVPSNKVSLINGILLNGVLIANFHYNSLTF